MEQSQLEIAIPYKNWPARLGLFLFLLTAPAWVLLCAVVLFNLPMLLLAPKGEYLSFFLTAFLILLACVFSTVALSDDKILISRSGMLLPLYMLPWLRFKRSRSWTDLRSAALISAQNGSGVVEFQFKSSGKMKLDLRKMPEEFAQKLLLGIDVWAPQCIKNDSLKNLTIGSSTLADGRSYSQLWEEELRRRFFPTSFVPLESESSLRNGDVVVVRQLAFGGFSAIYLAQLKEKDLVVLKESVVPANATSELKQKALEHFEREARLLSRLEHERISKVLDFFVENNRQYLLLEHIRGQDSRQLIIEKGKQSEATVLGWARQLAEILTYLHSQEPPIIHRDLTPDNIMLVGDKDLHLIDFGASNEFLGAATGTLVGKQSYISPEQFRGKATPQSDIYALGATVYYYLTGVEPEPLSTLSLPEELMVSEFMRAFVSRATAYKVEDRYASSAELLSELKQAERRLVETSRGNA